MNKKTDDLIDNLCGDLCTRRRRLLHPLVRGALLLALMAVYLGFVTGADGLRMDLDAQLQNTVFVFEIFLGALVGVMAIITSCFLAVPDMRGAGWLKSSTLTLFLAFLLLIGVRGATEGMTLHLLHWDMCYNHGLVIAIVAVPVVLLTAMRGATTHPYWMAGMNALAFGMVGWIGLRLSCSMDDVGHSFFSHYVPFALIGIVVGFLAKRLFRW